MTNKTVKNTWQKVKVGELCHIKHGYAFKGEYFSNIGNYILLTPGNFTESEGIILKGEKEKFYTGKFPEEYILKIGDLVVVLTDLKQSAPYLGAPGFVKYNNLLHNQRLGLLQNINEELIDKNFLYWIFQSHSYRAQVRGSASGSTVKHTAPERIYACEVLIPEDKSTQQKIASILSAFDDLIENNTKRIKILEDTAQLIYKEWFVDFKFPEYEKVKMIESGTEFGEIPEGWEVKNVGDVLKKIKRQKKLKKQDYVDCGSLPVVDQGSGLVGGYTNDVESLYEGDLPVIIFGDHTRRLKFIDFPFVVGADGTQLLIANTKRLPITLFYYALKSIDLSNFAYARHFKFLKAEKIIVSDEKTAEKFHQFVSPMREEIKNLTIQNQKLRQTRDLLLPRLVSGEIDVSDLDIN